MSVFALKLIAVVSMFIDHAALALRLSGRLTDGPLYLIGRTIGRPAFVIFCFLLVNGFDRTRDRRKYLGRLVLFALVSQIPFTLAFTGGNYRALSETLFSFDPLRALPLLLPLAVFYLTVCERRFTPSLLALAAAFALSAVRLDLGGIRLLDPRHLNVFYTLAVSLAIMMWLEYIRSEERSLPRVLLIAAALAAELYLMQRDADYGLMGVALALALYLLRGRRAFQLAAAALWCFVEYRWCIVEDRSCLPLLFGALAALPPIALYDGRLGYKLRTAFYVFYPAHLALLGAALIILSRQ